MRFLISAALLMFAASGAGAVTVVNGDFEAGNTGFNSNYMFVPVGAESMMGEAKYSVAHSAKDTHSSFVDFSDHTLGTAAGNYLVVNGSSQAGTIVWMSAPIAVTQGRYNFGAWLSSVYHVSPAMLQFTAQPDVGGAILLDTEVAPTATGVWESVGADLVVGAGVTSITLSIVNQNVDLSGNDFGIDDITLTSVPEPATWGLLIAGFVMVGAAARRRRGVLAA